MVEPSPSNLGCGFVSIREFATLQEAYAVVRSEEYPLPFVVRVANLSLEDSDLSVSSGSDSTTWSQTAQIRSQIKFERVVHGYDVDDITTKFTGREALRLWDENILPANIIDSGSTRGDGLLHPTMLDLAQQSDVHNIYWLAYVLSLVTSCPGELHVDPPHGSNWQYLSKGEKTWYTLSHTGSTPFNLKVNCLSLYIYIP